MMGTWEKRLKKKRHSLFPYEKDQGGCCVPDAFMCVELFYFPRKSLGGVIICISKWKPG